MLGSWLSKKQIRKLAVLARMGVLGQEKVMPNLLNKLNQWDRNALDVEGPIIWLDTVKHN